MSKLPIKKRSQKKYYVVWKGRQTGVYDNWEECEKQVKGFPEPAFLSFPSQQEAEEAFRGQYQYARQRKHTPQRNVTSIQPILDSYCVDASCIGNPGVMEYRCVNTASLMQVFHGGLFPLGTNNIGEFLAIVHALAWLKGRGLDTAIYSDSMIALKWVKDKQCKTNLKRHEKNEALFALIQRAEDWLAQHDYNNPLLKWHTELWGEIPADYNRK